MDQHLLDRLIESARLPSPPAVALQVLDLVQDPYVSMTALATTIGNDPSLSSKVLRTANSSFYAQSRRIATINDALVVLGLNTVRTLVLGFSLVDNLRSDQHSGFDHDAFWRRSLLTATAARAVAAHARPSRKEEAFLGGLLLNLGVLALSSGLDDYGATFRAAGGDYRALSDLAHRARANARGGRRRLRRRMASAATTNGVHAPPRRSRSGTRRGDRTRAPGRRRRRARRSVHGQ